MAEIPKLKKSITANKIQITKAYNTIVRDKKVEGMTNEEISVRLSSLRVYWQRFEEAQSQFELTVEEEEFEQIASSRSETEELYIITEFTMKNKLNTNNNLQSLNAHSTVQPSIASNINFVPFNEEESFTNFIKRFENFMQLKGVSDDTLKLYTLLSLLSPKLHEQLQDLVAPNDPYTMDLNSIVKLLREYLEPMPSVISLQHQFVCRVQQNESIMDFSMELKRLAKNCNFKCECGKLVSDILLRMQFVRGIKDNYIRGQILQNKSLNTFKDYVELAISLESSQFEGKMMSTNTTTAAEVLSMSKLNEVTSAKTKVKQHAQEYKYRETSGMDTKVRSRFDQLRGRCYRCGDQFHKADKCRFKEATCNVCNKIGHLARVCMGKSKVQHVNQLEENESITGQDHTIRDISNLKNIESLPEIGHTTWGINKLQINDSDKFMINIEIGNKPIKMELDTGAALSSISFKDFEKLNLNKKLFKTHIQLRTYTGEIIIPKGVAYIKFSFNNKSYFGKLYVIDKNVEPIFGRDWIREVDLEVGNIRSVKIDSTDVSKVLNEFPDVFKKELGCIPNERVHLSLREGSTPIFIKPRQVPYSLKGKVEEELNRLENAGIISKVTTSQWGTPIVPVVKPNGSVRICTDYKTTLNKVIENERYPIPRIEDIFSEMNGGKIYCTLDISNAYLHMPMDEESSIMQTISTEKGLYKVNRLMFGIKVAPSIWQRFMDKLLQDIRGVQCFFDDIIIQGANYQETLDRLKQVLYKLQEHNLKLNFEKCKFFQKRIVYLGHTIDEDGLHKGTEKVKAILEATRPKDVNQLRSFIGLANYYNKFIPKLAEKLSPMNKLLQKGRKFEWTRECEKCFTSVKRDIAKDETLIHYNPMLPLILSTDASPNGLGAVISHRLKDGSEKPIAFASRSLTKSEKHYSQIDKEATAIYWGVKKFFPYCYGRKFTLITDHKPLVSIFNPSKSLPVMSATRLLNYALFLSGFEYSIEYRRTTEHCNADFLSRFPVEKVEETDDVYSTFYMNQIATLPLNKQTIAEHTRKDAVLTKLVTALQNGHDLEPIGYHNNEFSLFNGCIFRGNRVMIPATLQKEVLRELHIGHIGMSKMKAMARSYVYWKNIDQHIDELVSNCKSCNQKRKEPPKDNIHPWEEPVGPWHRIHLDFMGPINSNYFLIVIDAYTKWLEVAHTKTTSSEWCIKKLQHIFSTFGLPFIIVTDNGPQFKSSAFENYLKENGICHKTTAPFHPSSNGQAERFVQTVKSGLCSMIDDQGDIQSKIDKLMMQLRKAPSSTTGVSAYKMMFGRDIRTKLNVMADKIENGTVKNQKTVKRKLYVGQKVLARNYASNEKWKLGEVIDQIGNVMYKVKMDNGTIWTRHIDQLLQKK